MVYTERRKWAADEWSMNPRQDNYSLELAVNETRRIISDVSPSQVYPPATKLFQQGSNAREVYFINCGLVKLTRVEKGGGELIVDLRFPNWLLGAATVLVQKSHPVTAITLLECHLHRIPVETFYELLKTNVPFSLHLHRMHGYEVINHIARVAQLGCLSAQQRLENLLWQLSSALRPNEAPKELHMQLPLKYWEIAQLIAVTPEYLCRLIKKMNSEGVIRQDKGWLVVTDFQKLWHQTEENKF
jgi:CRP/FNR family transcriptional regulator